MTVATLSAVREALAADLLAVDGLLNTFAQVPDSYPGICAVVQPAPGDVIGYKPAYGDDVDYHLLVTMHVPFTEAKAGQQALDPFLAASGPTSIVAAINNAPTLRAIVSSVRCNTARNYRAENIDEQRVLVVDFPVEVMT